MFLRDLQKVEYDDAIRAPRDAPIIETLTATLSGQEPGQIGETLKDVYWKYLTIGPVVSKSFEICGMHGMNVPEINTSRRPS